MEKETKKLLDWLVENQKQYIQSLQSVSQQDNVYTATVCLRAIEQFLENPKLLETI